MKSTKKNKFSTVKGYCRELEENRGKLAAWNGKDMKMTENTMVRSYLEKGINVMMFL